MLAEVQGSNVQNKQKNKQSAFSVTVLNEVSMSLTFALLHSGIIAVVPLLPTN